MRRTLAIVCVVLLSSVSLIAGSTCWGNCGPPPGPLCADGINNLPSPDANWQISAPAAGSKASVAMTKTSCVSALTSLVASLTSTTGANATVGVQVYDLSAGTCSSPTTETLLWQTDLAINSSQPSDHIVISNIPVSTADGDQMCIQFSGAVASAFESISATVVYQ